jgi:uncharacterized protein (DUF1499 family)
MAIRKGGGVRRIQGRSPAQGAGRARRTIAALGWIAIAAALAALLAAGLAGLGHRLGWWDFRAGFTLLRWSVYLGIGTAAIALPGLAAALAFRLRRSIAALLAALLISFSSFGLPLLQLQKARSLPPIHDITTDMENPPLFVEILAKRGDAPNTASYGGPEIAAQQRAGYPDLAPQFYRISPESLFGHALQAARELGWDIAAAVQDEGRIEATDTTFWFGFKDDVVIRISRVEGGSRLDLRSVSRVGRSDVGANAARIRKLLAALSGLPR